MSKEIYDLLKEITLEDYKCEQDEELSNPEEFLKKVLRDYAKIRRCYENLEAIV